MKTHISIYNTDYIENIASLESFCINDTTWKWTRENKKENSKNVRNIL